MKFEGIGLAGVQVVEPERKLDERGFFARTWCQREFEAVGLESKLVQCSISYNRRKGTLRGMHYQAAQSAEAKLVRCTAGAIYDVVLDLRADSPTYKQWRAVELTAENRKALFIPVGLAHGFLTLCDDVEVLYLMSEFFAPEHARGVRWNDPAFGIHWPSEIIVISERDRVYPDFVS